MNVLAGENLVDGLVSIIMPAHNSEKWITAAIRSVQTQSYSDWQLVISDDGSTDKTPMIAEKMAAIDPRIEVLRSIENSGPGSARNRAIARARGRWLAFLDSDDLWKPEKLKISLGHALDRQSTLTFTGFVTISETVGVLRRETSVPAELSYNELLFTNQIATSTALIDRNQWPNVKLREDFFFDDYILWLEILKSGVIAHGVNQPLAVYRIGQPSFSSNKMEAAKRVWAIYRKVENLSVTRSSFYFISYALNGAVKHFYRRAKF